jgi:hypothetical protein
VTSLVVRSGVLSLALLVCALAARGEDSDQRRYYLDLRYEDIASGITKSHDGAGISVGVNFNRYVGLELAFDAYDVKVGDVSEIEVLPFVAQVRLRYPLLHDRLTPYAMGGVGLSVTQANDARAPVMGGKTGGHPAGGLGGGVSTSSRTTSRLARRRTFSPATSTTSPGQNSSLNTGSALVGVNVRSLSGLHPEEVAAAARDDTGDSISACVPARRCSSTSNRSPVSMPHQSSRYSAATSRRCSAPRWARTSAAISASSCRWQTTR